MEGIVLVLVLREICIILTGGGISLLPVMAFKFELKGFETEKRRLSGEFNDDGGPYLVRL